MLGVMPFGVAKADTVGPVDVSGMLAFTVQTTSPGESFSVPSTSTGSYNANID